jgi:hypothetical protein
MDILLKRIDASKLSKLARETSLDKAVASFGDGITAGEYLALKELDSGELKALLDISAKINNIRAGDLAASDWTCVNVVC